MEQLQRFRIPFETINDCTKNFDKENLIGKGGYGNVYKGILSWTDHKNQPVAVKRLDKTGFQGNKEFYTEISMLSQYRHKNIIALVGFCDEGKEMIVLYEYASHGSLDKYLTNGTMLDQLSWKRRLKICIGIASALEYLHNHVAADHRVIHRDMKSANILLDEKWKPKLSDFGLSRIGLSNQQNTFLITNVAGTHGYCDPQYERTGILTKESDVYSLGVVLFEVLCGRLACVIEYHDQRRFLHHLVRTYYKNGEVEKIVDYRIRDHIKGIKMIEFSAIAYQCLQETREERPTIHEVVLQLKKLKDTQAARETGALQAAKNKLEKQVEELTWRLQLEKRMRADLEEAKTQENAKLQSALQDMQLQFKETKVLLIKERETAKKVVETVPVIQEVPVIDHDLTNKLTSENEKLKDLVSSLEKKIGDTEKKYEETNKLSKERLKQALDAETKIIQLKTDMQSLREKVSDMASENQLLRQKTLSTTSARMTEYPQTPEAKSISNGHFGNEEPQTSAARNLATEFDSKAKRPPIDRQHANVDALIECVMKDIGFSQGKPVAAFTIYKCLLHWKSFKAERTSVFDRLIQMIGSAIEDQDNNEHMAYWLSNASTLLFLLQRSIKSDGASSVRKPPTSVFGFERMTKGFRSSPLEVVRQVEAKYPALLFKQQLMAYVEKMFGIIHDNLKKELSPLLGFCIQAQRATKIVLRLGRLGKDSQFNYWQRIIDCLNTLLSTLKENFVPPIIVQKIITQIFSYINVRLFNSLLLRHECCTFSNGEYVRARLAELKLWCAQAKEEYAGSAWDELKHIRQAVGFLVIHQKYRISYDEIINDLCPILSVQQVYRICIQYWDDKFGTRSVSPDVISSMRVLMTEDSNNAASNSFLLDDDSSIPFSVDDLSSSLQVKDFADMKPAVELVENPAFQFLHD